MNIKAIHIVHSEKRVDNLALFEDIIPEIDKFVKSTGIRYRYVSPKNHKIEDYFVKGIQQVVNDVKTIDALITVTQTPSKLIPSLSNYLNQQLNFKEAISTYDFISGCSGYTEALILANALFQSTAAQRILICNGDFSSHIIDEKNYTVQPLFSDIAAITLLEKGTNQLFASNIKSYAEGYCAINSENGLMTLNGLDVYQFSTLHVANSIQELLSQNSLNREDISSFYFHQANKIITNTIIRQLKVSEERTPQSILEYGNSSSASIPLTLALNGASMRDNQKILLSGFGVGFKICNVVMETTNFNTNITALENC